MQTDLNHNTMQKTLSDFKSLCIKLQNRDNTHFIGGSKNYIKSYKLITNPIPYLDPPFNITDILDDAWNCKYITDQEYTAYQNLLTNLNK